MADVFSDQCAYFRGSPALPSFPGSTTQTDTLPVAVGLLDDLRRAMEGDPAEARAAAARLLAQVGTAPDWTPRRPRGGLAPWQARKVKSFLELHLERPVRLSELAEEVRLSLSHFCRAFKESFGTTPHTYIIRLRLELAQRLMLATEDPLSQISLGCGFADQAHLSKLFRRHLGETPMRWRRRNRREVVELGHHAM